MSAAALASVRTTISDALRAGPALETLGEAELLSIEAGRTDHLLDG